MAFTKDDIDKLDAATGPVASTEFQSRKMTFRTADEILKLRARMVAEVGPPAGTKRVRQLRMYSDKGF